MTVTIHAILDRFRLEATSNRDLGDKFEYLIFAYLRTDPTYASLFKRVWFWMDFPLRGKKGDLGIDLVAQEVATGDYWAIQCKCYQPDHVLDKGDIDSFFTASGKAPFTHRLIVTTCGWGKNAEDALKNQHIPVDRLSLYDLDQSPVDWSQVSSQNLRYADQRSVAAKHLEIFCFISVVFQIIDCFTTLLLEYPQSHYSSISKYYR